MKKLRPSSSERIACPTHIGKREQQLSQRSTPRNHDRREHGRKVKSGLVNTTTVADEYDWPKPAYVPWLETTVEHPEEYWNLFQERWDEGH